MQKVADIADISVLFFQGSANFWTRLGWEQEHYRNKKFIHHQLILLIHLSLDII